MHFKMCFTNFMEFCYVLFLTVEVASHWGCQNTLFCAKETQVKCDLMKFEFFIESFLKLSLPVQKPDCSPLASAFDCH